jgi:Wiskott-Aldrich syndrome protein
LYESFEYKNPKPFFHTFEGDDAVYGLSFTNDNDAIAFRTAVGGVCCLTSHERIFVQVHDSVPTGGVSATASTRQAPPPIPAGRSAGRAPLSPREPSEDHHDAVTAPAEPAELATTVVDAKKDDGAKKKSSVGGGGGGFMSTMRGLKGKIIGEKAPDVEISKPRDFRHMSSIGWTPETGFEIRNIPPEWRKLFQQAGVKKSELKDAETAGFIMDIIQKEGGLDSLTAPAAGNGASSSSTDEEPVSASTAPPPPPAPTVSAPKPPPPPTTVMMRVLCTHCIANDRVCQQRSAGAAAGGGAPRGGLLDQIKQGKGAMYYVLCVVHCVMCVCDHNHHRAEDSGGRERHQAC